MVRAAHDRRRCGRRAPVRCPADDRVPPHWRGRRPRAPSRRTRQPASRPAVPRRASALLRQPAPWPQRSSAAHRLVDGYRRRRPPNRRPQSAVRVPCGQRSQCPPARARGSRARRRRAQPPRRRTGVLVVLRAWAPRQTTPHERGWHHQVVATVGLQTPPARPVRPAHMVTYKYPILALYCRIAVCILAYNSRIKASATDPTIPSVFATTLSGVSPVRWCHG